MDTMDAELMLLGFISLMLGVLQSATQKICVKESVMRHLLPCPLPSAGHAGAKYGAAMFTSVLGGTRRLLSGGGAVDDYCLRKVFVLVSLPEYTKSLGNTLVGTNPARFC